MDSVEEPHQGYPAKKKRLSPYEKLKEKLKVIFQEEEGESYPEMEECIPKHWEKHGDLILLPEMAFQNSHWEKYDEQLWGIICEVLGAKRVARKHRISKDGFRTPQIELLKGTDGWVVHKDNGILCTYDVTKCMFSSGNITEKLRIAKFDCKDEIVVDMFAGIGYFTLPYLKHAKADIVHACEWNPDALEALEKNLRLNGVEDKCIVHYGDCRKVCPVDVADRVNLGLLPSSEIGWKPAARALKSDLGGIFHVHGNVTTKPSSCKTIQDSWECWAQEVAKSFRDIFNDIYNTNWHVRIIHVEHVKSYAPHIDHIVVDLKCEPE